MPAYAGSALYMAWIYSGGTVVLSGDFRTVNINRTLEIIDATAGADTYREKLHSFGDTEVTWTSVMQADGTALQTALAQKTYGTVVVGPEGSATGKPKFQVAAYSVGPTFNIAYNDIVEFSCSWISNAAPVETAWGA
jgi:hypothetical protein